MKYKNTMGKFYSELTTKDLVQHRKRIKNEMDKYTKYIKNLCVDIQIMDKELKSRTNDNK